MPIDRDLHTQVLTTQVRVRMDKSGGSGTIISSSPAGSYVITCHHVVESALSVRDEWDPRVGRQRKKEYRQVVGVEFFDWAAVPHGHRPLTSSVDAEVVAYDKPHDMALLRLRVARTDLPVAHLYPPESVTDIVVGNPCLAVGCALLHDPILTMGYITHMGDEIDFKTYWMSSAQIIFGNSGGAIFVPGPESYQFIGIPSRVDVVGWGSAVTHLGYFSPIARVYEFFSDQLYHFLIPGHPHSAEDCKTERAERQTQEERRLLVDAPAADLR